jgi:hypothetical protein
VRACVRGVKAYLASPDGLDEDESRGRACDRHATEDRLDNVRAERRPGRLEECVAVVVWRSSSTHVVTSCGRKLTVEVLSVQLLDELEHHPIERPLPKHVPGREALGPRRLPALVLRADRRLQLFQLLRNKGIVGARGVELRDYPTCVVDAPVPEQVPRRLGQEKDAAHEDQAPDHLQPDWDSPRCRVADRVRAEVDDVRQKDAGEHVQPRFACRERTSAHTR